MKNKPSINMALAETLKGTTVQIDYKRDEEHTDMDRVVENITVKQTKSGGFSIVGWCRKAAAVRSFNLDKVTKLILVSAAIKVAA
jgi:predicted DNA-binding transcriptional regulator YafY